MSCDAKVIWRQLVVAHVGLDEKFTEVGHLDGPKGLELKALPLEDGGLLIESDDGVFELSAP